MDFRLLGFTCILFAMNVLGAAEVDFSRSVLPILSDHCFPCHGPDEAQRHADLRLDRAEDALRSEDAVVVPGDAEASELIRRIVSGDPDEQMPPPEAKLAMTAAQIETLRKWVDQGARWGQHWAYVVPERHDPPEPDALSDDNNWVVNEIDRFVLRRLQKEGLEPAEQADRRALIRRVTLDLTGLPPTQIEIDSFVADRSANAYEKVVDRLLASPRFGERMAWDWLEVARFADTNGYQGDRTRTMWPWRDWVVRAFNDNMPFDQFTIEQLAGDLLPEPTLDQRIATGFHRNHMINGEGGRIPEENRVEYIFDQVETTATTWLGLTMTCSRCHDHKYDEIYLDDYYGLFAIFNNTPVTGAGGDGQTPPVVEVLSDSQRTRLDQLQSTVTRLAASVTQMEKTRANQIATSPSESETASAQTEPLPEALKKALGRPPAQRKPDQLLELAKFYRPADAPYADTLTELASALKAIASIHSGAPRVMVMEDSKQRETFVLTRGAYDKPGRKVPPRLVASLHPAPSDGPINRLTLARWIVDPKNPLTARVIVNRYWQMLFGSGLVRTPEDFGVQGSEPTHPELLDWLAVEFVQSGWDVKHLIRQIVSSATYRQSSYVGPDSYARDPDNTLLARGPRFRLPSWMIRDQALAISGLLERRIGGPPVKSYQPEGIWAEATFGKIRYTQDTGSKLYRRSLYLFWRRIVGPTTFFDVAKRQVCEVKPLRTNSPLHALVTLNDTTYVEAARVFAESILRQESSPATRIQLAFRSATGRSPAPAEVSILDTKLTQFFTDFQSDPEAARQLASVGQSPLAEDLSVIELAAYTSLCNLILNLDEVVTKE